MRPLTDRQMECLRVYAELGSQKAAAARLGISVSTLKNTLTRVYLQLGADGAIDAFRRLGWLRPKQLTRVERAVRYWQHR